MRIVLLVLVRAATAYAETLGVVVEAPTGIGGPLRVRIEGWATDQKLEPVAAPLSLDGAKTLANCIVIDDLKCASAVVDARGKADNIVYALVDATTTSLFWFRKGHAAVRRKLACSECSEELVASMLAKLMERSELTTTSLKVDSKPSGLAVVIDGQPAGTAPIEQEVEVGTHEVEVKDGDHVVARKRLRVEKGQPLEVTLSAHASVPYVERESSLWPWWVVSGGATLFGTGVVLYATSESPTGQHPQYLNDRPLGSGFMIGGAAIAAVGLYFVVKHGANTPLVIATTPGGAVVGFATVFK